VYTRRPAASFEPLNSSLPLSAPELHTRKAMCDLVVLAQKLPKPTRHHKVLSIVVMLEVCQHILDGNVMPDE